MNIVDAEPEADFAAALLSGGAQGFVTEPDLPILACYKRKGGVWAWHSPTVNEASELNAALAFTPHNAWRWIAK